jgi:hypothetical protein
MRRTQWMKAAAGLMLVASLTTLLASPARAAQTPDRRSLPANIRWIISAQLPDGAITQFPDRSRIDPYLANYAALGLASAYGRDHQPQELSAAWRWLRWYQDHMGGRGYVTDYTVGPAPTYVERSTGDEDSTDAYAGTFLLALRQTYVASGNGVELRSFATGIRKAIGAIRSTQQGDGLTWATPTYHAKLLMDQAESYAGLRAAQFLSGVLGLTELGARAAGAAERMRAGVAALWSASGSNGSYDRAKLEDGSRASSSWNVFYPDSVSQMWLLAVGNRLSPGQPLVDRARAAHLAGTFQATWPQWDRPGAEVTYDSGSHPVQYWPMVAGALLDAGRRAEAQAGVESIQNHAADAGRAWPFSVASAGQVELVQAG